MRIMSVQLLYYISYCGKSNNSLLMFTFQEFKRFVAVECLGDCDDDKDNYDDAYDGPYCCFLGHELVY